MKFHLKNSAGLFGRVEANPLMSTFGLRFAQNALLNPSDALKITEKDRHFLKEMLDTIETLPKGRIFGRLRENDGENMTFNEHEKKYGKNEYSEFYFLPSNAGFSATSDIRQNPGSCHTVHLDIPVFVDAIEKASLIKKHALLELFADHMNIFIGLSGVTSALRTSKKIKSGEYRISEINPEIEFGQSDSACMIFIANKDGGGYLSAKDTYVAIGAARLFESQGAAERAIKTKRLTGRAVVVRTKVELQQVIPRDDFKGDISRALASIAMIEKKNLLDALEGATIEQLKERLSKYENVSILDDKDKLPQKKRAM